MATIPHEPVGEKERRQAWLRVPEMWASLAIVAMWLAVLFAGVYGPDIVSTNGAGDIGTSTTVPSAVVVALFAFLGTWVVARKGFDREREG